MCNFKVVCSESKKGNQYWALVYDDIYVTFDRVIIEKILLANGMSLIDMYSMKVGEFIEL